MVPPGTPASAHPARGHDYGLAEARTTYGVIGVKCWIYDGEILEQKKRPEKPKVAEPVAAVAPAAPQAPPAPAPTPAAA